MRFGAVHRNTFIDAPTLLDETMQLRAAPGVYVAGQMSGVEGYVESAAAGLVCAVMLAQRIGGQEVTPPPAATALGGILTHLGRSHPKLRYQPSNITWAHFPPLEGKQRRLKKRDRYAKMSERALADLRGWVASVNAPEAYVAPEEPAAE